MQHCLHTYLVIALTGLLVSTPALSESKVKPSLDVGTGDGTPVMSDTAPELSDDTVTMEFAGAPETKGHGEPEKEGPSIEAARLESGHEGSKCVVELSTDQKDVEADRCTDVVDAIPMAVAPDGTAVPIASTETGSDVLIADRLKERRLEIEQRASEVALQESLLAATEKRIEERAADLAALEASIDAGVKAEEDAAAARYAAVVELYKGMKPAAAAAVFNKLENKVLTEIASAMDARTLSRIVAKMSPDRAGALTTLLAVRPAQR